MIERGVAGEIGEGSQVEFPSAEVFEGTERLSRELGG